MGASVGSNTQFVTKRLSASVTRPANTTAYADGDAVSTVTTDAHLEFEGAVRKQGGRMSGTINSARITSSANQVTLPAMDLWLFNADITETADNAAFAPTDAEALSRIGFIQFPEADWEPLNRGAGANGNAGCEVHGLNIVFQSVAPTIYGQLVVRNAYTPVSGEVFTVELMVTQD